MFILKVYRYNKWLAGGMLFFILMQLFCFYKGGMVVSPWYNYGMYSQRISIDSSYSVNRVGQLRGEDFSPQYWDKIHVTLSYYQAISKNDSLYQNEVIRIFKKLHIPAADKNLFVETLSPAAFEQWYISYLEKCLSVDIKKTIPAIVTEQYHYDPHIRKLVKDSIASSYAIQP